MSGFIHVTPASRLVCRSGAAGTLPAELAALGIRRPLLLAGRRTAASPLYRAVRTPLDGMPLAEITAVPAHSSVETVAAIVAAARDHRADGLVAVGGGSASDSAKAAALWLAEGGQLEDHATRFTPPGPPEIPDLAAPKLPIVAVPGTASGAEVTSSLGIRTAAGAKLLFWDPKLAARLVILDAEANLAVPADIMLTTGMNGLAHCIEGLIPGIRTPIAAALARQAMPMFLEALPRVAREPGSVEAREALLVAAHLSGLVLQNARTCLHHALCHALGALTGAAHGALNAVVLPHALAFNAPAAPEVATPALLAEIRSLQERLALPRRLRDLGIARDRLAPVAAKAMGERGVYFNPRPVDGPAVLQDLLEAAW